MTNRTQSQRTQSLPPAAVKRGAQQTAQRHLDPHLLFIVVYAAYNLLGLVNVPWIMPGVYDKSLGWTIFLTGLAGFAVGYVLFGRRRVDAIQNAGLPRTSKQLSAFFLLVFVACIAVSIITNHGLPLLQGESRFENSALTSNLAPLYGFWVLVRTLSDLENGRKVNLVPPAIYIFGILILGYRSPVLAFVAVCCLYLIVFRLSGKKAVIVSLLAVFVLAGFAAVLALFRVAQSYDVERFFTNVDFGYISEHRYLLPFAPALSMFDYSQNTIATIGSALHEHMYGGLFLSNYETFLPGKHWGARNIIGDMTGARWIAGRPMSITPTLQGALYVDFGCVGVFFGFLAIALGIARLHLYAARRGVIAKFSFCYLMTLLVMAIHAGYWDVNFIFFLLFLLIIRIFDHFKSLGRR